MSGPTGTVVVAWISSSANSPGQLRNGEWDATMGRACTPRRLALRSASQRGWDRSSEADG